MINKKIAVIIATILLISLISAGCVENEDDDVETLTIKDMLGREVEVPQEINRVVGLMAGSVRLLVYLDAVDLIAGVEDVEERPGRPYWFAHPELADMQKIGPQHGGEAEAIIAVEPDVIFITYVGDTEADELQDKTGIPVVGLEYGDLGPNREDLYGSLRLMGRILGRKDRAEEVITYMNDLIEDLDTRSSSSATESPRCYVGGIGQRGAHGLTSTILDYQPFEFVNADNVASDLGIGHKHLDSEQILEWDPEVMFLDAGGLEHIKEGFDTYAGVDAVRNERLYLLMPFNWYTTNFGTLLANAYYIGTVLYPEAFHDIDPADMANEIYENLVGASIYDDMVEMYEGGFGPIKIE